MLIGLQAVAMRPPKMLAEYSGATTEFPAYNMTQMLRHSAVKPPSQSRRRLDVPKTASQ